MVWAGISHVGKTNLIILNGNLNAQRYRDEILVPVVIHTSKLIIMPFSSKIMPAPIQLD